MSDFFAEEPTGTPGGQPGARPPGRVTRGRRPRPLLLTVIVVGVVVIGFSLFAGIWTDKLWFGSIGYSEVFSKLIWTRVLLFAAFGGLMAVVVGLNLFLAFRLRPMFRPASQEQANLERYREVITPMRRVLLIGVSVIFGIFAGISATGKWRTYLLWSNREDFGKADPYFGKDIGFYVFSLPWLHFLVDFAMTAVFTALLLAAVVHYLYGGIRLQSATDKVSGAAQAQLSALFGVFLLLKGFDYWIDRFDLTSQTGGLVTGMTYTRDHAVLPSKNILMFIAIICAVLFFANILRRTWLLPGVGLALFAISAVLLGAVWPGLMQRFQVKPDEPDKEASYIQKNIQATRSAFDLEETTVSEYDAQTKLSQAQLNSDAASLPGIRLVDPQLVSATFDQLQQVRGYYSVPGVLDVDRYPIKGQERDMVVAARELHQEGLPDAQKNWANEKTVYTHGYGLIAAYGNQQTADGQPIGNDGEPVFAEEDLPPDGAISDSQPGKKYRPQIYFGEQSPNYSIVGRPPGGNAVELDVPQGSGDPGSSRTNTYDGKDGVGVGNIFRRLLYAVHFGDANIVLSSRVNENSKILYDRTPRERVQKVAPWLTVDSDALPAVVDGKIVWILDGYTTSDKYPLAEKKSLQEMTSDAVNPRSAYATLPTDQINYMRNAVKATVDAYDGTVKLYEWDTTDPILKVWEKAFPGVVQKKSEIPAGVLAHMRYPEDLFKVQRDMLASYHVLDPKTFYEGNDKWDVPQDPSTSTRKQPPYRLSVSTVSGESPTFSLTSVFVPQKKQNLAAFMSVGADAAKPDSYGKFTVLRLPDNTQVPGPGQIANQFSNDPKVANQLRAFKQADAKVAYGNLLTLPVGDGLLYVQPLYTLRGDGSGNYPVLRFVLTSFGRDVGIGPTLSASLDDVLGLTGGDTPTPTDGSDGGTGTPRPGDTQDLPVAALRLLQQADDKFAEADAALKAGDLEGYATAVNEARALVQRALTAK
ncbi:MAG: hypothetical protein JWR85_372 [Marmoricola sp.]|nr:hypothetical protein [Marmoricola sp.]